MDKALNLAEPAFIRADDLPETARIIAGHVRGSTRQPMRDASASAPQSPVHSGDDFADEDCQPGWGPMPSDQELED